jgi:hypothetical protein
MRTKQHVQHRVVGYDPASEKLVFSLNVPDIALLPFRKLIRFEPDDPEGYDSYKLDYSLVSDLVGLLKKQRPPQELEYFIEPSDGSE